MRVLFVLSKSKEWKAGLPSIIFQGESLKNDNVTVDYFVYQRTGLTNYVKAVQLLRKRIKNNNYDIIHAHYSYSSLVTILSFPKVPLITSFMGSDILGFRKIDKIIKIVVEKFSDIIIVKSRQMAGKINCKEKLVIIPNGVNYNTFKAIDKFLAKKRLGLHPEIKYILWVGNSKRKEKNFKLVREVLRIIKEANVHIELIQVFGESQKKLNEYYSACDVFLLTSLYEGSPNVIKEAMACNCPIVSTDIGDVREVVRNTKGCYITSFDPNDVAEKIKMALNFGKRTNGRDHIKHLEINVIAKKIINVYEEILNIDE